MKNYSDDVHYTSHTSVCETYGTKKFKHFLSKVKIRNQTFRTNEYCVLTDQLKSVNIHFGIRYHEDDYDDGSSIWPDFFPKYNVRT